MISMHERFNLGIQVRHVHHPQIKNEDEPSNESSEESVQSSSLDRSSEKYSETESESGEVSHSSENPSISSGGNVIVQLSD